MKQLYNTRYSLSGIGFVAWHFTPFANSQSAPANADNLNPSLNLVIYCLINKSIHKNELQREYKTLFSPPRIHPWETEIPYLMKKLRG